MVCVGRFLSVRAHVREDISRRVVACCGVLWLLAFLFTILDQRLGI